MAEVEPQAGAVAFLDGNGLGGRVVLPAVAARVDVGAVVLAEDAHAVGEQLGKAHLVRPDPFRALERRLDQLDERLNRARIKLHPLMNRH